MDFLFDAGAVIYVLIVELAPLPQIWKLRLMKQSDQMSLLFTSQLAVGRLLALPYVFEKGAAILAWGFVAGAILRFILVGQAYYYQRRARMMQRFRDEEITI
ncbi:hypothetical protein Pan216_03800 [Planctomycetes bacterium Pan216]|uniref:PQ loop repeat protein n=1 Tax=Kolteria novifilia TaxID=2527975 RepID=A0A518AXV6_9BACT|nr:hypothetical protein Pan216_03800 [Planctomycetes bacterium Pan216]